MTQIKKPLLPLPILIVLLLLTTGSSYPAYGESNFLQQDTLLKQKSSVQQPVYTTSRLVTSRPVIDGKLDDECWKHGTWAGDYHQWIPREGAKPTYPTEMNIQYDDKYLYIAFRAYDGEPEKITRMAGVRDEIVGDVVGVTFDSYRDYRTGFEFSVTAWGQKIDLVLFNPMNWDFNWNAVWKTKVGLEDSAWVAEMEVPFSQLRYSSDDEQVWGMHTWRWISRLQEESNWEIQSRTGPGMLYNFGELRGIKGLKKSRRLEVMPFALGELRTMEKEPGNPFVKNGRVWGGNIGLDAKIGVSTNYTIDLTVNPDFGQVESDPSVMNLTAFETFYEEKRPFFLEGLTIFDYEFNNQTLFYSRRIGHSPSRNINPAEGSFVRMPDKTTILDAVKFSGTNSKGLSVGFIQSLTANEYAKISNTEGGSSTAIVEPMTNYMIARVQKGYKEGTTVIGGMLTSTNRFISDESLEFMPAGAFTGGLDLLHRFRDKEFFIDARLTGSHVTGSAEAITLLQESSARYYQRPGADYLNYDATRTQLSGHGGKFEIGKGAKGFWRYSTEVTWRSPGLELNDLGYMRTADEINQESEVSYFVNQPVSIFNFYTVELEQSNAWNFNGSYLGSGGHLSFRSEFRNNWNFNANLIAGTRTLDSRLLRGGNDFIKPWNLMTFGGFKTDPSKKIIADLDFRYGFSGNDSEKGFEISPGFSVRPLNALKIGISATYEENTNELQYVSTVNYTPDKRYILARIDQETLGLTFRVDLNITPEFSVQYYGSPFVSRGSYSDFKRVIRPKADQYSDRFELLGNPVLSDGFYQIDENNDLEPDYSIRNPDFNFHQFRSNLVARWEYRLGSFIYLVWSGERTGFTDLPDASIGESYSELRKVFPRNIFLIKLNYWFSL
ncbi:MAG: carbohydrate binding family 9 domain-containing protein [Bacteroidales bacterium]|nr:carbohydrate binding family 9 domain-containing protein [Bacteroidales bacterium]